MIPEISASKVAGYIGLHKYQDPNEIAYELLCKDLVAKTKIAELERVHGRRPFNQVLNEVLKEWPIQDCIRAGIKSAQTTSNVVAVLEETEAQAGLVLELRRDSFTPELRARLATEIRGQVSKQRGLRNENNILDQYETQRDVKVTERNTKTVRKDFGTFKLVGRTDGFVASENRIVDSKDRTRFWSQVPLYDEIQLRVYMNMTGATEAELIERFPDGQVRHTKYMNDETKWAKLQEAMERATARINLALHDDEELKRIVFLNTVCTSHGDNDTLNNATGLTV